MKIALTQEELNKIVSQQYGCDVEEVIIVTSTDGWISNIGRNKNGYPDTLNPDTKIEVKHRDGKITSGFAPIWNSSWRETDNDPRDIIAYRILKS